MKTMKLRTILLCAFISSASAQMQAQSKLYPRLFDLQEVTLDEGMYKHALELNDSVLL